jgi:hypothetical protein
VNHLLHWNGTDQEFWQAVVNQVSGHESQPTAESILGEVLRLAQERALQIDRSLQPDAEPRQATTSGSMPDDAWLLWADGMDDL